MSTSLSFVNTTLNSGVQVLNSNSSLTTTIPEPQDNNQKELEEENDYMVMNSGVSSTGDPGSEISSGHSKISRFFCTILESSPHNSGGEEDDKGIAKETGHSELSTYILRKSCLKSPVSVEKEDSRISQRKSLSPSNIKSTEDDDYGMIMPAPINENALQSCIQKINLINSPSSASTIILSQQRSRATIAAAKNRQQQVRKISESYRPQQQAYSNQSPQLPMPKHLEMTNSSSVSNIEEFRIIRSVTNVVGNKDSTSKEGQKASLKTNKNSNPLPQLPPIRLCDYAILKADN